MAQRGARSARATTVIASFDDLAATNEAIDRLYQHGFETGNISVWGPAIDEANRPQYAEARESEALTRVGRSIGRGALLGGLAGLAIGIVVAVIFRVADWPWGWQVGFPIALFVFGAVAGALLWSYQTLDPSPQWEETLVDVKGKAFVAVHEQNPDALARATEILRESPTLDLRRFDADRHEL